MSAAAPGAVTWSFCCDFRCPVKTCHEPDCSSWGPEAPLPPTNKPLPSPVWMESVRKRPFLPFWNPPGLPCGWEPTTTVATDGFWNELWAPGSLRAWPQCSERPGSARRQEESLGLLAL